MYPQQHHASLFTQQPYSSNSFFLHVPQAVVPPSVNSDSGLHPPGTDPLGNSGIYAFVHSSQTVNSLDSNAGAVNWMVKQISPMKFEAVS